MTGMRVDMGRTAVVVSGGVEVVLMEHKAMPFDAEQLRCVGIEPSRKRIIAVKSAIAWKAAYGEFARRIIQVDTPGSCSGNLQSFSYKRRPHPLYPFEISITVPECSEVAFTYSEYDRRMRAAREAMTRFGVDVMLLFDPASIGYLTGFSTVNLWDTVCLIVSQTAEPVTVFGRFERERFKISSYFRAHISYPPEGDCITATTELLKQQGHSSDTIGIEVSRYLDAASLARLRSSLDGYKLYEHSGLLDEARIVKSAEELEVLRKAARLTDAGIEAGRAAVKSGATDYEICAEAARALIAGGSDFMCIQPIVAAGDRTGVAHSSTAGYIVREGDAVFLELGACVHRYTAPLMRTIVLGRPTKDLQELADTSSRALDAMIGCIGGGAIASEVARAGEKGACPFARAD
jgi:Xaa-Pro dipeptidase